MQTIKITQASPQRPLTCVSLFCLMSLLLGACTQHQGGTHKPLTPSKINEQGTPSTQPHIITVPLIPLQQWKTYPFAGNTHYSASRDEKEDVIKAHSINSASMIYQKMNIPLSETPFLQWSWKIEHTFSDINERTRQGDDFAARLYIAVKGKNGSFYPRTLTYVWSSNAAIHSHWQSPYSSQAILLAINSGEKNKNRWVSHKRNLKEDLQHYFNEEFDHIEGIAIMTDSDNTHSEATAYYKNIFFSQE